MRYISTLATRFSGQGFLIIFCILMLARVAHSTVLERVVAIIGDSPVFFSEFLEFKRELSSGNSVLSDEEILERLIDRKLLLMEASRLRLDTVGGEKMDPDAIIDRYLDLAVRVFIPGSRAKKRLKDDFSDDSMPKDEEFSRRLKKKIAALRKQYDIRIYLEI